MLNAATPAREDNITKLIRNTSRYILSCQQENGSILWFTDGKLDPWDHTEAAMGLAITGEYEAAKKAFLWLLEHQNQDGSWYAKYYGPKSEDQDQHKIETNFVAYPACGLWHYYLVTKDIAFIEQCFSSIEKAIDYVISKQKPEGDIQWAESTVEELPQDALVTACASILRSLECALRLANLLSLKKEPWQLAYQKLADVLKNKPWRFDRTWEPKTRFSMDWFYPILAGIYSKEEAELRIDARWHDFVHPTLGCRCVSDEPWVTIAESCELTLALIASGRAQQAQSLFNSLLQWQDQDGGFWTGYSFRDKVIWPLEKTSWTAAAILLAADALNTITPAAQLFTSPSHLLFTQETE